MKKKILNQKIRIFLLLVLAYSVALCPSLLAQHRIAALMNQKADSLNQKVVNVAYGKASNNSVSSAISTISSTDLTMQVVPVVGDALVGRLPGLTVRKNSGIPGIPPDLVIRGQGTYNSTQPLVIVDGFRADFNQLSIYEIESISILKDAAATVLYGMDAANGVILVTTKRGHDGKLRIDAHLNYGVQQPTQLPELLDATQYANYYNQALVNDGLPEKFSASDIASYGQGGDFQYTHPNNDFVGDFLKNNSPIMLGGLNISGGNDKSKYMVALGYLANEGILNQSDLNSYSTQVRMDKINIRTNLDINILKGLSAAVDVAVCFDNKNYPGNNLNNIIGTLLQTPPQAYPIINPNGSLGGNATYKSNPLGMISQSGYQTSLQRNLDVNLRMKYAFGRGLKGLSLETAGASSTWMTLWDNKTRSYATYSIDNPNDLAGTAYTQHGDSTNLAWSTDVITYKRLTFEGKANYSRVFGSHSLDGMLMYHMDRYVQQISTVNPYNFDNAGLGFRINYGNSEKYFAELAGSYYGQEQYREDNRFKFFPSASIAWVASNENFLRSQNQLNYLKFRASYGIVGGGSGILYPGYNVQNRLHYNQYYQKLGGVNFGETNSYSPASASYQLGNLANPNISSDLSHKTNLGVEAKLLDHFNIKFDYFYDKRTDILSINNLLPSTMGFAGRLPYANGGQVNNQGYELSVDYFGQKGDFSYLINGSVWYNKSKLVKKPDVIPLPGVDQRSGIGMPVGQIFGYEAIGFYASDEEARNASVKQTFGNTQAGDVIYKDNTGDGKIDISDMVPLGYSFIPQYTYSTSFELKYKGVYLSALGQGTMNSTVMLGGYVVPFSTQGNAYQSFAQKSWSPQTASTAKYPRLSTTSNSNNTQPSSIWMSSADYFKLRSVEIGYDLNKGWLDNFNFKAVRICLRGTDLFTVAKELKHIDPETMSIYPSLKSYSLGISLTL